MAALGLGRAAPCPTSAANAGPGGERRGRGPDGARGSARLRPAAAPPYKVGRSGEARPARECRPAGNRRRGPLGGVGSLQPKIVLKKKLKKGKKKKLNQKGEAAAAEPAAQAVCQRVPCPHRRARPRSGGSVRGSRGRRRRPLAPARPSPAFVWPGRARGAPRERRRHWLPPIMCQSRHSGGSARHRPLRKHRLGFPTA